MDTRVKCGAVIIVLIGSFYAQAQTPTAAIKHFQDGSSKAIKGDLEGAIRDFTRAIELNAHLTASPKYQNSTADSSSQIIVVDPFTANAYANRGVARYRLRDFEGAIDDFNRALRIRSGPGVVAL